MEVKKTTKKTNPENFDDGITQVAPKGEFTPMKNELELSEKLNEAVSEIRK